MEGYRKPAGGRGGLRGERRLEDEFCEDWEKEELLNDEIEE